MRKQIKTIYKGLASVRDYEVEQCIKKNESMTIIYDGDAMTLSPEQLKTERVGMSSLMKSQYGKDYVLFNYPWEPEQIEL